MSNTEIVISALPDLCGLPPSKAVSTNSKTDCCSRSNCLSNTNTGTLVPPLLVCTFRLKWLFALIW
uniref:Uncharacterized protein n=1 Tax=Callorhinchus milii TaxID=7868 RepID=A0A4W3JTA2_CALMI